MSGSESMKSSRPGSDGNTPVSSRRPTSFDYVRDYYGVPARRGMRVTVDGKPGVLARGDGQYIRVRFDGENFSRPCHPTWRVVYMDQPDPRPFSERPDLIERFWTRTEVTLGCWNWTGNLTMGYGRMSIDGTEWVIHRFAYELFVGPIPEGLQIDHLCKNTRCVNPAHLEPVTLVENVMRGESLQARNARKTHCKRGHEFTPENTSIHIRGGKRHRHCRACDRARAALSEPEEPR